jgi:hypothetical protein
MYYGYAVGLKYSTTSIAGAWPTLALATRHHTACHASIMLGVYRCIFTQ